MKISGNLCCDFLGNSEEHEVLSLQTQQRATLCSMKMISAFATSTCNPSCSRPLCYRNMEEKLKVSYYFMLQKGIWVKIHFISTEVSGAPWLNIEGFSKSGTLTSVSNTMSEVVIDQGMFLCSSCLLFFSSWGFIPCYRCISVWFTKKISFSHNWTCIISITCH